MNKHERSSTANQTLRDEYFSEKEAAQRLGVARITLLRLRQRGAIGYHRIGTRVVYSAGQLREYLDSVERRPLGARESR